MKTSIQVFSVCAIAALLQCQTRPNNDEIQAELQDINLSRGDIALCGTGDFGQVDFSLSCAETVQQDFNLATSMLHSFEYTEAEKVFAKIIDRDPACIMAYWGVAMANFHPLWSPPGPEELSKGLKTIQLARKLDAASPREAQYIETIATIFDGWENSDHKTRLKKFTEASEALYLKYPQDKETAIFYALALRASADPADKTFEKQKKAGEILRNMFPAEPNHPGIAHYLIHIYDYPELAEIALPAARKYAAIASKSAHALHMPSHIFTRLGLWEESIQSNISSMDAARCYAEKLGKPGHWDQELHGLDYLVYAYLQQGNDEKAKEQVEYLKTITDVFPASGVNAYTFAATPMRFAMERKDWKTAATLELGPANFAWDKHQWEKAIHHFGKLMGAVQLKNIATANAEFTELEKIHTSLEQNKKEYEANQVSIQLKASEAWIQFMSGKKEEGLKLLTLAADMEDATEKHSVTPGEIVPARELLGDMYMAAGNYTKAAEAYKANLTKRPNRFNSLYGAAFASEKANNSTEARMYYSTLINVAGAANKNRQELVAADVFLKRTL
ncbi:MAG TPA: hypothetical protein VD927_08580 [Chryseosolibacter sp.]|nr:hypothetical protein [Chryseosolibacter sp.]